MFQIWPPAVGMDLRAPQVHCIISQEGVVIPSSTCALAIPIRTGLKKWPTTISRIAMI